MFQDMPKPRLKASKSKVSQDGNMYSWMKPDEAFAELGKETRKMAALKEELRQLNVRMEQCKYNLREVNAALDDMEDAEKVW